MRRAGACSLGTFHHSKVIGDTGDSDATPFRLNALDLGRVKRALNQSSEITGRFDFNRDGRVTALDLGIIKANLNKSLSEFTAPIPPAAAAVPAPPLFSVASMNLVSETAVPEVWDQPGCSCWLKRVTAISLVE